RDGPEHGLDRLLEAADSGHEDEHADQTVDDARHRDQQLDQEGERVGEAPGHQLGEADRGAEAERERDRDRDRGGGERPVDEGEGPEAERDRVPRRRPEEAPPEGRPPASIQARNFLIAAPFSASLMRAGTSSQVKLAMGYASAPAGSVIETRKSSGIFSAAAAAAAVTLSSVACTNFPLRLRTSP